MDGWFAFFGVEKHPHFHIEAAESLGYLILILPSLMHLQMWFCSPDDGWETSPWASSFADISSYECCQRTMVEWRIIFAWPFVKLLPNVVIGGAVKKDSKIKWDGLLALLSAAKDAMGYSVAEERAILNTPRSLL